MKCPPLLLDRHCVLGWSSLMLLPLRAVSTGTVSQKKPFSQSCFIRAIFYHSNRKPARLSGVLATFVEMGLWEMHIAVLTAEMFVLNLLQNHLGLVGGQQEA